MASLDQRSGNLGKSLAAHLLRRCTFAPTKARIDAVANMTAHEAVDNLLNFTPLIHPLPIDPKTGQEWVTNGQDDTNNSDDFRLRNYVRAWWINEALAPDYSDGTVRLSMEHKLTFFLHSIWNTHFETMSADYFYDYITLVRYYTKGNYKELAEKMTLNNFMLRYLDNGSNTDETINENYAREFLELFTIGKGPQVGPGDYTNYTEHDVAEATKVFTGFRIDWHREDENKDPDTGIHAGRPKWWGHVQDDKTFSHAFGNQTITGAKLGQYNQTNIDAMEVDMYRELRDFIDMVFNQDATARYIIGKMYRFFVSRNITPEVEANVINPLATEFKNADYNLEVPLKKLLKSVHFYDEDDSNTGDEIIGALIKSPLDLVSNVISQLDIQVPDIMDIPEGYGEMETSPYLFDEFYRRSVFYVMFENAGFDLFAPPSVAGYPAYYQEPTFHRNWFNSGTIIARYKLPEMFITGKRVITWGTLGGVKLDIVDFVKNNISNAKNANILVDEMLALLLPVAVSTERRAYFLDDILMNHLPYFDWKEDWEAYIADPNDAMKEGAVKGPLEDLITAILYSPEFQMS